MIKPKPMNKDKQEKIISRTETFAEQVEEMKSLGLTNMSDLIKYRRGISAGFTKEQLDYLFDELI